MNGLPQNLKGRSNFQNHVKRESEMQIVQVYYLDELVDVMTHHLIGGHSKEGLELVSRKGILRPRQYKASIVPNTG